jgi:hypothetical protein
VAWTAPKIALMLKSLPAAKWQPPAVQGKTVNTSPRQLASMEKSGVQ